MNNAPGQAPTPGRGDTRILHRMRLHRLKGLAEMAAGMAHEINQPLGGIRGFAEGILIGMEEGWDITDDEIMGKMRRIIAEADRIDELIQGIRAFANESARLDVVEVDVLTVTRAAMRLIGTRLQAHGIDLQLTAVGGPARVRANPFGLQEVVQILLVNAGDACDARQSGGGAVHVTVDSGMTGDAPVTVTVTDDGIGMDPVTLTRAGEPFFTTKGPDRGVGLGLAMAGGILAQCGGRLDLRSRQGSGTVATVHLTQRIPGGCDA